LSKVYIIQNSLQRSHTIGIDIASNKKAIHIQLSILKELAKIFLRRSEQTFYFFLQNFSHLFFLKTQRKPTIFIFLAPYDWRMAILKFLIPRSAKTYIVTSQLNWSKENASSMFFFNFSYKSWLKLINRSEFIGLNDVAYKNGHKEFKKKHLIYHSVNTNNIQTKHPKKSRAIVVGYAGRLRAEKGINELLWLAKKFPNIKFLFAGWGNLEKKIQNLHLPNVDFRGRLYGDDLFRFYIECDYITQLSTKVIKENYKWEDVFGLSVAEAICYGCIPIISDMPAPVQVFKNLSPDNLIVAPTINNKIDLNTIELIFDNLKKKDISSFSIPEKINKDIVAMQWKKLLND
jgi:glycosyltransferase involved in cell wall biosynthesis